MLPKLVKQVFGPLSPQQGFHLPMPHCSIPQPTLLLNKAMSLLGPFQRQGANPLLMMWKSPLAFQPRQMPDRTKRHVPIPLPWRPPVPQVTGNGRKYPDRVGSPSMMTRAPRHSSPLDSLDSTFLNGPLTMEAVPPIRTK